MQEYIVRFIRVGVNCSVGVSSVQIGKEPLSGRLLLSMLGRTKTQFLCDEVAITDQASQETERLFLKEVSHFDQESGTDLPVPWITILREISMKTHQAYIIILSCLSMPTCKTIITCNCLIALVC